MSCNCGKPNSYDLCCGKFIEGNEFPASAEDLMRSRYSAFCHKEIDYILDTTDIQTRQEFSFDENLKWAESVQFTKLEVLKSSQDGNKGTVEFKAYYTVLADKSEHVHHEISKFRKHKDQWFYREGKVL